ncbi:effector-associated constant component EACC1 [Streptomyces coelicoflavus]|uniref:effector-associated constant component EACC1 n=1 Tax=Streptomyces coelicoflavus TaxID=285562 RepID=UPI00131F4641|nr:hypothetical protein [Streptomyces coelicoflavus]
MRVRVTVEGGESGDADDLLNWLRKDPAGAEARPLLTGGSPDQMGAGETIQAAFDTALATGGFVIAAATWLEARRERGTERRRLRIERDGNRKVVTVDGADSEQIEEALRALLDSDENPEGRGQ